MSPTKSEENMILKRNRLLKSEENMILKRNRLLKNNLKSYIFVTMEGETYSPEIEVDGYTVGRESTENLQVIGFAHGRDQKEAFNALVLGSGDLLSHTYNELIAFELKHLDFHKHSGYFYLDSVRPTKEGDSDENRKEGI